ncbi:helix-turn-helix domain-containing protein [Facklamia sp. P9177]|uniref:helix-turn-helix domain-containing protein n=1 Tax=Facklamia sp. P9177 TaxID=3421945 RepID=UPI003D16832D
MSLGQQLKTARLHANLTQEEVAEKIGVTRQSVSNWENEKNYPDIRSVIDLSNLYQISLDQLMKGDEKLINHYQESSNVVRSNKHLFKIILISLTIILALFILHHLMPNHVEWLLAIFIIMAITAGIIIHEIIQTI